jgi:hypothetical protein
VAADSQAEAVMGERDLLDRKTGPKYTNMFEGAERPAPTHIRGVGAVRPNRGQADQGAETVLKAVDKALEAASKAFVTYATQKGQQERQFSEVLQQTVVVMTKEAIERRGTAALQALPFSTVIQLSTQLSLAFADGVQQGLDQANAKLRDRYDFSRLGTGEVTEADKELMQGMRQYLAINAAELPRIVRAGLFAVVEKAIDMVFAKMAEIAGQVVKDLVGQVATQLFDRNELLALVGQATNQATTSIPEQRRKIYTLTFHYVANAFIGQLDRPDLKDKLAPVLGVARGDKSIHVGLLAGIIQVLINGSYQTYLRATDLEGSGDELRAILLERARALVDALPGLNVALEPTAGSTVEVTPERVGVPSWIYDQLTNDQAGQTVEEKRRWERRWYQFLAYVQAEQLAYKATIAHYQRTIDVNGITDPHHRVFKKAVDALKRANDNITNAQRAVLKEFGKQFGDTNVEAMVGVPSVIRIKLRTADGQVF